MGKHCFNFFYSIKKMMKPLKRIGKGKLRTVKQKQTNSVYVKGKEKHLPGYVDMGEVEKEVENPSKLLGKLKPIDTPNQEYNKQSAYARYRKASTEVFLSKIVNTEQDNNPLTKYKTFWFPSNNASDGYWNVLMTSRTYYLKVRRRTLYLFGESSYQLREWIEIFQEDGEIQLFNVEEDDEFKWEQIEGIRQVFLNGGTDTVITGIPSLYISGSAGVESPVDRSIPITLRIYPPGDKHLFDELTIWTTPTSFVEGLSLNSSYQDDRNITQYWYYPFSEEEEYPYGNYYSWSIGSEESVLVTWAISSTLKDNLVSIHWLIQVIGNKIIYNTYIPDEPKLLWINKLIHYYPLLTWDWFGDKESYESTPLYILDKRIDFAHDFLKSRHLSLLEKCVNYLTEYPLIFRRITKEETLSDFSLSPCQSSLNEYDISFNTLTVIEALYVRRTRSLIGGSIRTLVSGEERTLATLKGGTHSFSLPLSINTWVELGVDFGIIG
jgi:hypothetical protein